MNFTAELCTGPDCDPVPCKVEVRTYHATVEMLITTDDGSMITLHANRGKIIQQAKEGVGQANFIGMILTGLRGNAESKGIIPPVVGAPASIERTGQDE